jgi:hypothetical protein
MDSMVSKRNLSMVIGVVVVAVVIIFAALWQAGYVVADHTIVKGKDLVPVPGLGSGENTNTTTNDSSNQSFFNLFFILMNQLKDVPGFDKLSVQVFYSNSSASSVENEYKVLMDKRGYTPQPQYSSSISQLGQTITYNTYTRGITGVVVFVSSFLGKTYVCYVTGSVFDLMQVYNYMKAHGYLQ